MDHDNNQDLKTIFNHINVPGIDVTKSVMNQLEEDKMNNRGKFFAKYKISTLVIIGSLLVASSAFAAAHLSTLTNSKGDVVYEEKKFEKSAIPNNTKGKQVRSLKANRLGQDLLKPGQAAAIYMAGDNSEGELHVVRGSRLEFSDSASLRNELKGSGARTFDKLQDKYDFVGSSLSYYPNQLSDQEEAALTDQLEQEARNSKQQYAMKMLDVSKENWSMIARYKGEGQTILVQPIRTNNMLRIHLAEEPTAKTITVDGVEMLYSEYESGSKGVRFIYNIPNSDFHINYYIEATKGVTKDELLAMAKAYLQ
ncbi:hypothetical protein [Paenibacillus tuaregi]|uniref:hypothetical protein n=1 Tax=Paenibacillus tuaregi TaxID=1816681 RepID=UPI000838E856|nr:hypothetical protein [Paenibacillus tuaregi]